MSRGAFLPATLLIFLGVWLYDPNMLTQTTSRLEQPSVNRVIPSHLTVVDGDTVRLAGQAIRLIGFDTPATYQAQCAAERDVGEAATARLRDLLAESSSAQLAYLPRRDQYGRDLARLMLDGRDVADIMVSEGLARRYNEGQRRPWC